MTDKQRVQQDYPPNYQPYEDEINLIDYFRVLWKWKWLIVAGTLICAIIAAVYSLQLPRIYEVSAMIEPGIAGVKAGGGFTYIDSAANISAKINGAAYNERIKDTLHTGVSFKSAVVKKTSLINVTSQWEERNTDLGVNVTRKLIHLIVGDFETILNQKNEYYSEQISAVRNETINAKSRKNQQQADLASVKQRKTHLLRTIDDVRETSKRIVQQRDLLLRNKTAVNDIELLLYSTTVQQNVAYFNQLGNELYGLNLKEEALKARIEEFPQDMADMEARINTLNRQKSLISNIQIINEPKASAAPVKPKVKQIVLLAGVVALFMFVFLAFFIEYIRNASKEK